MFSFHLALPWRSVLNSLPKMISLDFLYTLTWTSLFSSQLSSLRPGYFIFSLLFFNSLRKLWGRVERRGSVEMVSCFVTIAGLCGLSLRY